MTFSPVEVGAGMLAHECMNALLFIIIDAEIGPGSLDDIQGQNAVGPIHR